MCVTIDGDSSRRREDSDMIKEFQPESRERAKLREGVMADTETGESL